CRSYPILRQLWFSWLFMVDMPPWRYLQRFLFVGFPIKKGLWLGLYCMRWVHSCSTRLRLTRRLDFFWPPFISLRLDWHSWRRRPIHLSWPWVMKGQLLSD